MNGVCCFQGVGVVWALGLRSEATWWDVLTASGCPPEPTVSFGGKRLAKGFSTGA